MDYLKVFQECGNTVNLTAFASYIDIVIPARVHTNMTLFVFSELFFFQPSFTILKVPQAPMTANLLASAVNHKNGCNYCFDAFIFLPSPSSSSSSWRVIYHSFPLSLAENFI